MPFVAGELRTLASWRVPYHIGDVCSTVLREAFDRLQSMAGRNRCGVREVSSSSRARVESAGLEDGGLIAVPGSAARRRGSLSSRPRGRAGS